MREKYTKTTRKIRTLPYILLYYYTTDVFKDDKRRQILKSSVVHAMYNRVLQGFSYGFSRTALSRIEKLSLPVPAETDKGSEVGLGDTPQVVGSCSEWSRSAAQNVSLSSCIRLLTETPMCKCDARIRSPWCGRGECQPPEMNGAIGARPIETREERIERCARRLIARYIQASDGGENLFIATVFIPKRTSGSSYTRQLWLDLRNALEEEV